MAYKVIILFTVMAAGQAQILKHTTAPASLDYTAGTPYAYAAHTPFTATSGDHYYDPNPSYEFNYSINDAVTGDSKTQSESRQGDVVQGSYSFIEADGSRRVVDYTADPVSGFNANVHKEVAGPVPVAASSPEAPVAIPRASPFGYASLAYPPLAASKYATPAIVSNSFASPYSSYAY